MGQALLGKKKTSEESFLREGRKNRSSSLSILNCVLNTWSQRHQCMKVLLVTLKIGENHVSTNFLPLFPFSPSEIFYIPSPPFLTNTESSCA